HLAYLLGEVLSKADKFWYKGGYLKLNQEIKKAKQLYKIHQEYKEKLQELNLCFCSFFCVKQETLWNFLDIIWQEWDDGHCIV
ncbi:MAG: hypothetical protein K2N75_01615, partial [Helicobacter sp.]|uniref:hypothetical protein n=2 Tax=Helicobacter TaxID=209 RepID=UPI0023CADE8B